MKLDKLIKYIKNKDKQLILEETNFYADRDSNRSKIALDLYGLGDYSAEDCVTIAGRNGKHTDIRIEKKF